MTMTMAMVVAVQWLALEGTMVPADFVVLAIVSEEKAMVLEAYLADEGSEVLAFAAAPR